MTTADGAEIQGSVDFSANKTSTILKLAIPTVFAMLMQSIVNDDRRRLFLASADQLEASNAQAALLPSLIFVWLFGGSLGAISVGTQALTARRYAEGKFHAAGAVLANAVLFSLVGGVFTSLFGVRRASRRSSSSSCSRRPRSARSRSRTRTGASSASSRCR